MGVSRTGLDYFSRQKGSARRRNRAERGRGPGNPKNPALCAVYRTARVQRVRLAPHSKCSGATPGSGAPNRDHALIRARDAPPRSFAIMQRLRDGHCIRISCLKQGAFLLRSEKRQGRWAPPDSAQTRVSVSFRGMTLLVDRGESRRYRESLGIAAAASVQSA